MPPRHWEDERLEYISGDLIYHGRSVTHNAATDTGELWWVKKYTYTDGEITRIQGPIECNWDDRTTTF